MKKWSVRLAPALRALARAASASWRSLGGI